MFYTYPAVFYAEDNGTYSVIFPDLNNLATQGDTLEEAMAMAQEACSQYLFTSLKDKEPIPTPTALQDVVPDDATGFVNLVFANLDEYAKKYGDKTVRKNLTIPAWLNTVAEEQGINFSKVLYEGLLNKITR